MYIVAKYQINLHLLRNRLEQALVLKLEQINFIFSDDVRILYT